LFQTAQYILNSCRLESPYSVSKVYCLFALAKQAKTLGAFKLARDAYTRLLSLKVPAAWREQIDLNCLTIRSKPFNDKDELIPVCYRCSSPCPLLSSSGDNCSTCGHTFVRSFCSFEVLPLVEFALESSIPHEEAMKLIGSAPRDVRTKQDRGVEKGAVQTLTIDGGDDGNDAEDDVFGQQLLQGIESKTSTITVDRAVLRRMKKHEVFARPWPTGRTGHQYFKSMIPDIPIASCSHCRHFFHQEDFEFHVSQKKSCPFCRAHIEGAGELGDK